MPLPAECMQKGHPSYGGGRPRTAIPSKEELIELGEDLVRWASAPHKKGEPLRLRYCEWYTEKGFVRKQWKEFFDKEEFSTYYERAQSILARKYIDGTVNQSIAHRYLRIYDPDVKEEEDQTANENEIRKASALKSEAKAIEQAKQEVLEEVAREKRIPK